MYKYKYRENRSRWAELSTLTAALLVCGNAFAMMDAAPNHKINYQFDSRDAVSEISSTEDVISSVIHIDDAAWLQIHFREWNLGANGTMTITALEDGAKQHFTGETLAKHKGLSAYFNGDEVRIEIRSTRKDLIRTNALYVQTDEITVGDYPSDAMPESQCGGTDDRTPTDDPRVARVVTTGGTAWLASNGAILTAGHVTARYPNNRVIEFNVPASNPTTGAIVHPPVEDQYTIDVINDKDNGQGDDYSVFSVLPNANTGLTPHQAQGAAFRMSRDLPSTNPTIRITGYGDDTQNERYRVEQTHTGPFVGESSNILEYQVDTYNANSGSPVQRDGTDTTYGIHTHGGCRNPMTQGGNHGTSFENDDLEALIQQFPERSAGQDIVYLDSGHPTTNEDGTVFRPYDTFDEALSAVTTDGMIHPVSGTYTVSTVIDGDFTISAPAIGQFVLRAD